MKITFISPYPDITSFGIRVMSAYLRQAGHQTRLIFLPDPYGNNIVPGVKRYKDHVLDGIIPLCDDSDVIGITLMTNFFESAVQITEKIKSRVKKPIIWGGVHPTVRPEECLQYADIVCVGDGEEAVLELIEKMEKGEPYLSVENFWFKENGSLTQNPPRSLTRNLDIYPVPDYSLEDRHIMHEEKIQPLTYDLLKLYLEKSASATSFFKHFKKIGYQTMTGRGCPHKCTYCINATLKEIYNNENYLRWRSPTHVIDELLWMKENMPYVGYIWISDDAFSARSKKNLEEFCKVYKEKINMPFACLVSPLTISEEKMDILVDGGMRVLQMGVESGSKKIQELFNRKQMGNERLKEVFYIINKYKDRIYPPLYNFILDIPYETDEDKIESLKLISEIPKPFFIQLFSLVLYPGTGLYEIAKNDNLIGDEKKQIYEKIYTRTMRDANYLDLLITLSKSSRLPGSLLKFLISAPLLNILNSKPMKPLIKVIYIGMKTIYRFGRKFIRKREAKSFAS